MESCPDCGLAKQTYGEVVISIKHYVALSGAAPMEPEYVPGAACNLDGTGC
jgi:hypothetical protein